MSACCQRLGWCLLATVALLALPGALLGATPGVSPAHAAASAPAYFFRQPPEAGLVTPPAHLLTTGERSFLAQLPVVRVGLNLPDNRPYEVITANGEISGIQIEILTHVAQALGLRLVPVVLPSFPAALAALRDRQVDVMATVGYQPAREAYMTYTLGTAPNPGAILGREADNRFVTVPTLNGRRVAVERDYVTQYYVRRLYPEAQVVDQPDTAAALRAVASGEDDFYFGSLLMATDRLQRDHIAGLAVKQSLVYATGLMHFGVRSDWPLLAGALSKGVAALRQSPLPALQAALAGLGPQSLTGAVPRALSLDRQEQAQLAGRSVLRVGAVRGLALLNEALPGGGHAGIAADYTVQVAARLGTAVDVVPFDSVALMLDALRSGDIHLAPLLTRTPRRALEFAYSDPYLEMPYHVIARSDAPLYWDLASLRGKRLALTAQHPLREFLAQRYPDIVVVDAPPGEGAMDMVAARQADAAVEAKLYANLRINNDNNGVLRQVARVDEIPAQFHFASSLEAAALMPLVNRALADISADERERLYRRWVAVDFNPGFAWRRHAPWLATAAAALLLGLGGTAWWMRRLAREVRSRTQAEQNLREMANSLPGVVFQSVVGTNGRLEQHYLSDSAQSFLGVAVPHAGSLPALILAGLAAPQAAALRTAQAQSLASGLPFAQTFCYQHPVHGPRWLHCEATVRPLAGERMAWTGYLSDVSAEVALRNQLLDAVQAKNLFVANASHELRSPLQAITLGLQHLGEGVLNPAQRQSWRVVQQACDALLLLIDDLLDLARLEAGRWRLQPTPVALATMLAQIADQHRLSAEARGLGFTLELLPGLPEVVYLDALRLRQLLANLVGNAIKYTPAGSVRLRAAPLAAVAGAAAGAGDDWLCLSVQDTGIGISTAQQALLFEPFGALHPAGADPARSTGLGLAICKRLVQAMHGEIVVISQPGAGTEVRVHLPLLPLPATATATTMPTQPAVNPAAPASPTAPVPPPRHGTVLMVDDDPVSRILLAEMLRRAGYPVLEAASADEALALWQQQPVVAVISDRHMPGGDGPALLRQISDDAQASGRPRPCRLLCTGDVDPSLAGEVELMLSKPVTVQILARALASLGVMPAPGSW